MAGIFISYRQDDTEAWAILLCESLAKVFGEQQVFLDKDTLHAGNWRDQLNQALDRCAVVLIVVGPRWLTIVDRQNRPRISLPDDVHHQEVALALSRPDVTVIPVLVDEAPMPRPDQLPTDLHRLCDQQAYKIGDTQARRKADLEALIKNIRTVGGFDVRAEECIKSDGDPPLKSFSWFRLDLVALGSAVALTVGSAILAFLSNTPFTNGEPVVLLPLFYVLVLGAKYLWHGRVN
ncbi:MAG: toll/interleukin-1 receptor domain-containing protein [Nitrospira sp.]|nr:toll/interleukin-1 receptor domain-containing protein [Nitrospira sp.]